MILGILISLAALYISILLFPKKVFRGIGVICAPIVRLYIKKRISDGLEDKSRFKERFGIPSKTRPNGPLVWIHSVSVGETLSVIPIIELIKAENKNITILLTTTTLTAAKQVEERLKDKVIHQFIPFDVYKWIRRFVKYWKPNLVFFVESELWPNTLYYLYEKDIPTHLLNVRISNRSLKRMHVVAKYLKIMPFSLFRSVFVPSIELKVNVQALGAKETIMLPNMKTISAKLPVNAENSKRISSQISNRKVWIAVSTHPGEEEIILEAHKKLKEAYPDILTILAIRHPSRNTEVLNLCSKFELSASLYSDLIDSEKPIDGDIYIIDKIGCLGDLFENIKTALVCGSLIPEIGGHNVLEPLNFGCNVATGQYIDNFRDIYPTVKDQCVMVKNVDEIREFVENSIKNKSSRKTQNGMDFMKKWQYAIQQTLKIISNR